MARCENKAAYTLSHRPCRGLTRCIVNVHMLTRGPGRAGDSVFLISLRSSQAPLSLQLQNPSYFFFFVVVLWPNGMWDLTSLIRARTRAPCIGSRDS